MKVNVVLTVAVDVVPLFAPTSCAGVVGAEHVVSTLVAEVHLELNLEHAWFVIKVDERNSRLTTAHICETLDVSQHSLHCRFCCLVALNASLASGNC